MGAVGTRLSSRRSQDPKQVSAISRNRVSKTLRRRPGARGGRWGSDGRRAASRFPRAASLPANSILAPPPVLRVEEAPRVVAGAISRRYQPEEGVALRRSQSSLSTGAA